MPDSLEPHLDLLVSGPVSEMDKLIQVLVTSASVQTRILPTPMNGERVASGLESVYTVMLECLDRDRELPEILDTMARRLEAALPGTACSVLLLDESRRVLRHGAAPSLPEAYNRLVDGLAIGAGIGCCGNAAATGQRTIARNLEDHPFWTAYQALLPILGRRSCWSEPILDRDRNVLGTFAIYRDEPSEPTMDDIRCIEGAAQLLALAIERRREASQRAKAIEDLRRSEERFRALTRAAPVGIFQTDLAGSCLFVNEEWCRYSGLKPSEAHGNGWIRALHPEDRERVAEQWRLIVDANQKSAANQEFRSTYRFVTPDGNVVWLQAIAVLVRGPDGGPNGYIGSLTDITERRRAEMERHHVEARMQELQRLESLSVLAGGIAHDFNNILVAILGHTDLALADLREDTPAFENLNEVLKASRRAADLCRQMLAFAGRGRFVEVPIDFTSILEDMSWPALVGGRLRLNIDHELDHEIPRIKVLGDPAQVRQILSNLVTNAAEALPPGSGVIEISLHCRVVHSEELRESALPENTNPGLHMVLSISDNGAGMDEITRRRVFEPFFSTKFVGRGLGLAAVLGIVRSHGGTLRITTAPHVGTRVDVFFPCVRVPQDHSG